VPLRDTIGAIRTIGSATHLLPDTGIAASGFLVGDGIRVTGSRATAAASATATVHGVHRALRLRGREQPPADIGLGAEHEHTNEYIRSAERPALAP
jgi:hypothetical protein